MEYRDNFGRRIMSTVLLQQLATRKKLPSTEDRGQTDRALLFVLTQLFVTVLLTP